MNEQRKESFQQQAEQNIDAAALQMARRIQNPGQSRDQTKLIAQGIAKGIALYKKQQNEKVRERDKRRKRLAKENERTINADKPDAGVETPIPERTARVPFWIAVSVLGFAALLHLARWAVALPITVGTWDVPVWWSLPIAVGLGGVAIWLVLAVRSFRRRAV